MLNTCSCISGRIDVIINTENCQKCLKKYRRFGYINLVQRGQKIELVYSHDVEQPSPDPRGRGVLPKKLGRGVRPASQNPYPIYGADRQWVSKFHASVLN